MLVLSPENVSLISAVYAHEMARSRRDDVGPGAVATISPGSAELIGLLSDAQLKEMANRIAKYLILGLSDEKLTEDERQFAEALKERYAA